MSLILVNLQSNQLIKLDNENPLIIGRGNVEGCFDKRVSRNHGRITCTFDGKIRLEALHCNPCFITRNGVPPIVQVNKNEEQTLSEGDFLGLLPNAFWFKVTKDESIKIKREAEDIKTEIISDDSNSANIAEENHSTAVPENKSVVQEDVIKSQENSNSSSSVLNPSCTSGGFGTPEFEKTRRLPLWMYEIDDPTETNQSWNKRSVGSDLFSSRKKQKTEVDKEDGDNADGGGDVNAFNIPSTSRVVNNKESESLSCSEGSAAQKESREDGNKKEYKNGYESDANHEGEFHSRPICQYEGKCYRKNPQHKLDFSHPGDSDYVAHENRPLCPYGGACYRKSKKHEVEFRHSKPSTSSSRGSIASSPLPAKRRRKKVKKENSDVEDSDEYDLEDPFINDASSDEYVPTVFDSEEEEEDLDASSEEN